MDVLLALFLSSRFAPRAAKQSGFLGRFCHACECINERYRVAASEALRDLMMSNTIDVSEKTSQ